MTFEMLDNQSTRITHNEHTYIHTNKHKYTLFIIEKPKIWHHHNGIQSTSVTLSPSLSLSVFIHTSVECRLL